ncbi:hypothetical protein ABZ845_28395 [Streptomyces sp. NPDC047022]|uniref:hypothetical protein n=1 Tax=Streptomyces sp. NPDC047022 TaxID=3155737 RepID=UPI0033BFC66C
MVPEDLRRGLEALKTFKSQVEDVLSTFEGSPGSSSKVADHTIARASFSGAGAFAEAAGLHTAYERAHAQVTSLSQTLGLQIEALQIAVHGADIGFDNLDEELRRRFYEIGSELKQHADKTRSDDKQSKAGY